MRYIPYKKTPRTIRTGKQIYNRYYNSVFFTWWVSITVLVTCSTAALSVSSFPLTLLFRLKEVNTRSPFCFCEFLNLNLHLILILTPSVRPLRLHHAMLPFVVTLFAYCRHIAFYVITFSLIFTRFAGSVDVLFIYLFIHISLSVTSLVLRT